MILFTSMEFKFARREDTGIIKWKEIIILGGRNILTVMIYITHFSTTTEFFTENILIDTV